MVSAKAIVLTGKPTSNWLPVKAALKQNEEKSVSGVAGVPLSGMITSFIATYPASRIDVPEADFTGVCWRESVR
jgi:hypothetical protein